MSTPGSVLEESEEDSGKMDLNYRGFASRWARQSYLGQALFRRDTNGPEVKRTEVGKPTLAKKFHTAAHDPGLNLVSMPEFCFPEEAVGWGCVTGLGGIICGDNDVCLSFLFFLPSLPSFLVVLGMGPGALQMVSKYSTPGQHPSQWQWPLTLWIQTLTHKSMVNKHGWYIWSDTTDYLLSWPPNTYRVLTLS
jgi:hypothetical protein